MSLKKATRRKEQFFNRTKYRKATLTRDFWGTILDKDGEILIPDGHNDGCWRGCYHAPCSKSIRKNEMARNILLTLRTPYPFLKEGVSLKVQYNSGG